MQQAGAGEIGQHWAPVFGASELEAASASTRGLFLKRVRPRRVRLARRSAWIAPSREESDEQAQAQSAEHQTHKKPKIRPHIGIQLSSRTSVRQHRAESARSSAQGAAHALHDHADRGPITISRSRSVERVARADRGDRRAVAHPTHQVELAKCRVSLGSSLSTCRDRSGLFVPWSTDEQLQSQPLWHSRAERANQRKDAGVLQIVCSTLAGTRGR